MRTKIRPATPEELQIRKVGQKLSGSVTEEIGWFRIHSARWMMQGTRSKEVGLGFYLRGTLSTGKHFGVLLWLWPTEWREYAVYTGELVGRGGLRLRRPVRLYRRSQFGKFIKSLTDAGAIGKHHLSDMVELAEEPEAVFDGLEILLVVTTTVRRDGMMVRTYEAKSYRGPKRYYPDVY